MSTVTATWNIHAAWANAELILMLKEAVHTITTGLWRIKQQRYLTLKYPWTCMPRHVTGELAASGNGIKAQEQEVTTYFIDCNVLDGIKGNKDDTGFNFHHTELRAGPVDPSYYISFITLRNVINVRSIPQDCSISMKQPVPATLKSIHDSEIHTWLQLSNMSQKMS